MKKVSSPQVVTTTEASELLLPAEIQEALGELVGAAREGLLALSVGLGLGVVHQLMEREVDEVVGPKGKHDPDRTAKRHGHENGSMTLGGRRVAVCRPRIRTADDEHELPVSSYEYFADRDPLTRAVMDRVLAGVSTRKYKVVGEPVGEEVEQEASSTSKSTVSELFIERTRTALSELMARRLDDVRLAVMMLDGLEIADRTHVVALGISTEGVKIPLGLWEGSTENATLVGMLLSDLVDRGLDPEQAILFVIDGGKALRKAIRDVFGEHALVHRCHRHKERNVCDLLPERDRPQILARIRLLLVVETDAVIDGGERAASVEVGRGVCRAVETGQQRASVGDRGDPPLAESVVAAVRLRELEFRAEEIDRAGLAVVVREDRGVPALGGWNLPPRARYRVDEAGPTDRVALGGIERDHDAPLKITFG